MALAQPHIRMHHAVIQTVAIGFLLCVEHQLAQAVGRQELLLAALKHRRFKQVAAVDVADDLAGVHELGFQDRQTLTVGLCGGVGGVVDDVFVEGGGRFRYGHGVFLVQRAVIVEVHVVEGMAQLVRQRDDVGIGPVEVCQDAALADGLDGAAECAADLALARIKVDPCVVKGLLPHGAKILVEAAEEPENDVARLFQRVFLVVFAHGREHIVPWHPVFVAQRFGLAAQIGPELGQIFVDGGEHGVERFALHPRVVERALQGRFVAAQMAVGEHLQLDGVERVGHGVRDLRIAGKLCLVGFLTGRGVGVIGEIADGRQRRLAAAEIHLYRGGQVGLKLLPCVRAGQAHARHDLLFPLAQKIAAVLLDVGQKIAVIGQQGIGVDQGVQIFLFCHKLPEGSLRAGDGGQLVHQAAGNGGAFGVLCVGGLTQTGIEEHPLGKVGEGFFQLQRCADLGGGGAGTIVRGQLLITGAQLVQLFQVGLKFRAVKAGVKRVQRPSFVHEFAPFISHRRQTAALFGFLWRSSQSQVIRPQIATLQ